MIPEPSLTLLQKMLQEGVKLGQKARSKKEAAAAEQEKHFEELSDAYRKAALETLIYITQAENSRRLRKSEVEVARLWDKVSAMSRNNDNHFSGCAGAFARFWAETPLKAKVDWTFVRSVHDGFRHYATEKGIRINSGGGGGGGGGACELEEIFKAKMFGPSQRKVLWLPEDPDKNDLRWH